MSEEDSRWSAIRAVGSLLGGVAAFLGLTVVLGGLIGGLVGGVFVGVLIFAILFFGRKSRSEAPKHTPRSKTETTGERRRQLQREADEEVYAKAVELKRMTLSSETTPKTFLLPRIEIAPPKGERKPEATEPRIICQKRVDLKPGTHERIDLNVEEPAEIWGVVKELGGSTFDLYVMDEENYDRFDTGNRFKAIIEMVDIQAKQIKFRLPRKGTWHLVIDIESKQKPRSIDVRLKSRSVVE